MTGNNMLLSSMFFLLFAAGLGLQSFARRNELQRRRQERFRTALDRHERITFVDLLDSTGSIARPTLDKTLPLPSRIFGYDPSRLDLYRWSPAATIIAALVVGCLVGCMADLLFGAMGLLLALPLWPIIARMLFRRWERKQASTLFEQFPDALAMVVRGVRVGIPVTEAIGAVSRDGTVPTSFEFGRVVEQVTIGIPLDEALRTMAERTGLPEYRFFATALALQGQTGGNLSETLESLADTIRKRVAARARGYALAAEARTSANVLAVLPILLFGALWFMNPRYVLQLITESTGHIILGTTLFMLGLGILSMRTLIRRSLS